MIKITKDIIASARRLLNSWKRASIETGAPEDTEFQVREAANVLGVDYRLLKKKI